MQVIRQERIAKAQGIGLLVLMAGVAASVHYWPSRTPEPPAAARVAVAANEPPRVIAAATPMARTSPVRRRVRPVVSLAAVPAVEQAPALPPLQPLRRLPGGALAMDVAVRATQLTPAPVRPAAVTQRAASQRKAGAVTRAAESTGKGLAVAFQKTGAALRRAF